MNSGQCVCKSHVSGRNCGQCKQGYYRLKGQDVFGCKRELKDSLLQNHRSELRIREEVAGGGGEVFDDFFQNFKSNRNFESQWIFHG